MIFTEPYAAAPEDLAEALGRRGYEFRKQDFNGDIEAIQVVGAEPIPVSDPRGRGISVIVK